MAKVEGTDRLKRKLAKFPKRAAFQIDQAMTKAARDVVAMAKRLVPVDDGDLQASINWTYGDPPSGAISVGKVNLKPGGKVKGAALEDIRISIYAGDEQAYYARWVEFGTKPGVAGERTPDTRAPGRNRTRLQYRTHPGTQAQPFFYPSWRANRKSFKRRVNAAIRKAAREVAAG